MLFEYIHILICYSLSSIPSKYFLDWGISANCASGYTSYTPTGMETACYWGGKINLKNFLLLSSINQNFETNFFIIDKAIGEACTNEKGSGG